MSVDAFPIALTLALSFDAPGYLIALLLMAVPFILHWLFRQPEREQPWAAMAILRQAIARRSRRTRFQTWLLMVLRMLVIGLAMLAFARPLIDRGGAQQSQSASHRRILIVDTSLSMGSREESKTPLEQVQDRAQAILDQGGSRDSYRMLQIAPVSEAPIVVRHTSSDLAAFAREVERLEQTDGAGDPGAALSTAIEWIERSDAANSDPWEVVILSDFQDANWTGTAERRTRTSRLLQTIAQKSHLVLVPVGERRIDNAAIVNVTRKTSLVRMGSPVQFTVTLQSFGGRERQNVAIEARVGDSVRGVARVDLPAEGQVATDLTLSLDEPGEAAVEFVLATDAVPADNRAYAVVPVHEHLRILVVDSETRGEGLRPRDFIRLALDPRTATAGTPATSSDDWLEIETIDAIDLARQSLNTFDVIYLAGVSRLTRNESDMLERFVRTGGGLIVGMSPTVDVENYNALLYRDGKGLLPAKLAGWFEPPDDASTTIALAANPHPILDPFVGNPDSGLTTTRAWGYARFENVAMPPVAALINGDPVLIEQKYGQGRCLVSALSFDSRGSNWTVWPSFVPLIQELTAYAASSGEPPTSMAGQPLAFGAIDEDQARVRLPNGDVESLDVSSTNAVDVATLMQTSQAGFYQLIVGDGSGITVGVAQIPAHPANTRSRLAAVNPDIAESSLQRLAPEDLRALLNGLPLTIDEDWTPNLAAPSSGSPRSARDLASPLLWAVLFLALTEVAMTWRFLLGAGILAAGAMASIAWTLTGNPAAMLVTLAVIGAAALGLAGWKRRHST